MSNMPATSATSDAMRALWDNYKTSVSAWEAAGTPFEGESVKAMKGAEERFINARTTSLTGILLKLEHVAETDNLAKAPEMTVSRLVLGLIDDLKSELVNAVRRPDLPT